MLMYISGVDSFRRKEKLAELIANFKQKVDSTGSSLNFYIGTNISPVTVDGVLRSTSLFSRRQMIVIADFSEEKQTSVFKELLAVLERFKQEKTEGKQENIIVISDEYEPGRTSSGKDKLFGFIKDQADYSWHFPQLNARETAAWVKNRIESLGKSITLHLADKLVSISGVDLWTLNNEINKLVNFKPASEVEVSDDDLKILINSSIDENIFLLVDSISSRNKAKIAQILSEQTDAGLNELYILSMIQRQFKLLLLCGELAQEGAPEKIIASKLKIHPFVAQKTLSQSRNFSLNEIRSIHNRLIELEFDFKTGVAPIGVGLEQIFLN